VSCNALLFPMRYRLMILLLSCLSGWVGAAPVVRVLAWDEEVAERKLALVSGTSSLDVTNMHPHKRSDPLRVRGNGPHAIHALDKGPAADGKPVLLSCPIPESMKFPLLILLADEEHASGLRVVVFDDDPAGFRWGGYRFLNATSKDLIVQMENRAVNVPGGWKPVDFHLGGENRGFGARIALAESIETPIYTGVWEYEDDVRVLCFLVPGEDPRLSPVALKTISEFRGAAITAE
jgi:hypothetical protein